MTEERLITLIIRRLTGELNTEEVRELEVWVKEDARRQVLLDRFSSEEELERELARYRRFDPSAAYLDWRWEVRSPRRMRYSRVTGWAVAATLLAAAVIGGLSRYAERVKFVSTPVAKAAVKVLPGRNTATLTLSNGQRILLDSAVAGDLTKDGNARLVKPDSISLSYQALAGSRSATVAYNTLITPRSGQYRLTLADGSKVWLNNVSSLRFPTVFEGKERVVELSGEGYFEVARDPAKPFIVKVGEESVEVLGTTFNIMAYPDEGETQTTLVSGAVRVRSEKSALQLAEDDQARTNAEGTFDVVHHVPSLDIISWKSGFFYFGPSASFASVMRQLSRWYNIDVVYEGRVPGLEFGGKIDRELSLEDLLKYLDKNQVRFRLEGRKLIVLAN